MREVILTSILQGFDQKNHFFEGWSSFKFNNFGVALGMTLKFYTSVEKGLKLKIRKIWGLISTVVEVIGEKTGREAFSPRVLNQFGCTGLLRRRKLEHLDGKNWACFT